MNKKDVKTILVATLIAAGMFGATAAKEYVKGLNQASLTEWIQSLNKSHLRVVATGECSAPAGRIRGG